jgi:hypothetical protein
MDTKITADYSKRTAVIRRYYVAALICSLIMVASFSWLVYGMTRYGYVVSKSSSPIGTTLSFDRSDATIAISDLYTDESQSVLIIRFAASEQEWAKLPHRGSDYRVFLSSDLYPKDITEVPVLLGKLSTDGDMFLVIPKPSSDIYNVFLMNTNFINIDTVSGGPSQSRGRGDVVTLSDDETRQSLTAALSRYHYSDQQDRRGVIVIENDGFDAVAFRVTLKPAFATDAYRPKVLKGTLLSDEGIFEYEQFFNVAFKEASLSSLESQHTRLSEEHGLYQSRLREMKDRLIENPNDVGAQNALDETERILSSLEFQMQEIAEQVLLYGELEYNPSMFSNLQTRAEILHER